MLKARATYLSTLIAAALGSASPVGAAEIQLHESDDGFDAISIDGEIEAGDEEKFRDLALKSDSAVVFMSSGGGALIPALEIGKIIQIKGFATYVPDNILCTSSCALIWLAGSKRALSSSAQIGFHASYRDNNGRLEEVGVANAMVGRYLTLLNLPERTVIFATSASPDQILWLKTDKSDNSGIDFQIVNLEDEPTTPSPPPIRTAPIASTQASDAQRYAERVEWYYGSEGEAGSILYLRGQDVNASSASSRSNQVWVKTEDSNNSNVAFQSSMRLYTVDCVSKRYLENTITLYYRSGKSETHEGSAKWTHIVPDSVFEGAIELVCSDQLPYPDDRDQLRQ